MGKFRPGDKVRYVRDFLRGAVDYAQYFNLKKGSIYEVEKLHPFDDTQICLLPATTYTKWFNEEQFDMARMSNKRRVAKRMEELNV